MLISRFRKEYAENIVIYRPRLKIQITTDNVSVISYGLLDSGADRTIIPEALAQILRLNKGQIVYTAGIGGQTEGYESVVNIIFVDETEKTEKIVEVPVYVIPDFRDIVIGRKKVFDEFRITFELFKNQIIMEKAKLFSV